MKGNNMKKSKSIALIIGLIILISSHMVKLPVLAKEDPKENHYIIIYDYSGSMDSIDEEREALDMVALFINKIPQEAYPMKLSVISFADEINILKNETEDWWEFEDVNDFQNRKWIRDQVSATEYNGEHTDIGGVMNVCVELLKKMEETAENCQQTVVFITDGYIDMEESRNESQDESQNKSQMRNVIGSYNNLINSAKEFPSGVNFFAIVPDKDYEPKEIVRKNEKIVNYYHKNVSDDEQEDIEKVINAINEFAGELKKKQIEGERDRIRIEEINWNESGALDRVGEIYTEFFDEIFDTKEIVKENINLKDGYEFFIPEGMDEVNITIVPEEKGTEERRKVVKEIMDNNNIFVSKDKNVIVDSKKDTWEADYISNSGSAITININNPIEGNYYINSEKEMDVTVTLKFSVYGNFEFEISYDESGVVLGEPLRFEGEILNDVGEDTTNKLGKYLTFYVKDNDEYIPLDVNITDDGIEFDYIFTSIGKHNIVIEGEYNDSIRNDSGKNGITGIVFRTERKEFDIPAVEYELLGLEKQYDTYETIKMRICPYSMIGEEKVLIDPSGCIEYLGDKWVLVVDGETEEKLNANEADQTFEISKNFEKADNYKLQFKNMATNKIIECDIEIISPVIGKTDKIPKVVEIECFLTEEKCTTEVETGTWFTGKDIENCRIEFVQGDYFEVKSTETTLNSQNKLLITHRLDEKFHVPQEEIISYIIRNQYDEICLEGEIEIQEKVAPILQKTVAGTAGILFMVLLANVIRMIRTKKYVIYEDEEIISKGRVSAAGKTAKKRNDIYVRLEDGKIIAEYNEKKYEEDGQGNIYI